MIFNKLLVSKCTLMLSTNFFSLCLLVSAREVLTVELEAIVWNKYAKPIDPSSNPRVFTHTSFGKMTHGGLSEAGKPPPKMNKALEEDIFFIESSFDIEGIYKDTLQVVPEATNHGYRASEIYAYKNNSLIPSQNTTLVFEKGQQRDQVMSKKFNNIKLLGLNLLDLDGCAANKADLERFIQHCPNLKTLRMPPCIDFSTGAIKLPEGLHSLTVSGSSLGEDFFQSLTKIETLKSLSLRGCRIPAIETRHGVSTEASIHLLMTRLEALELSLCSSSLEALFFSSDQSSVADLSIISDSVSALNNLIRQKVIGVDEKFVHKFPNLNALSVNVLIGANNYEKVENIWLNKYDGIAPKTLKRVTLVLDTKNKVFP